MVGENTTISREDLAVEKNNEGVSRFKAGDLAGAARAFQEALQFDPSLDEARENRDMAIKRLGRDPVDDDAELVRTRREEDFAIDTGGDTLEKLVQYALYALAAVIGIALMVGIYAILGPLGIVLLIVGCLFVWGIKWSWLLFLK
ncbi:MAG: tetratricopeptide repeat protein [Chloroflexota bacterium]|nr:tetratricopeptide repeat protein [Chloroflexota bacterium]